MWIYRRIDRTSWKQKRTSIEVLGKLRVKRELMEEITKRQINCPSYKISHDTLTNYKCHTIGRAKDRLAVFRQW